MSTHTPGPWRHDGGLVRAKAYAVAVVTGDGVVRFSTSLDEISANARLIAAAPDLLAACEAIVALEDGQGRLNLPMCAGQARAALARATGKDGRS